MYADEPLLQGTTSRLPTTGAYQNHTAFRDAERRYKKSGPNDVDLTDVIDIRHIDRNTAANAALLRRIPLVDYSSSADCFTSAGGAEPMCYAVSAIPGLYLLPRAVDQQTEVDLCRAAILEYGNSSRFPNLLSTHVKTPVRTSCYRPPMRWATIGFSYQWTSKSYERANYTPFPNAVRTLMQRLSKAVFEADALDERVAGVPRYSQPDIYEPQSGIVNYFPVGSSMMAHQDASEVALTQPLLSLSLGASSIFLMGTASREDPPLAFLLRTGDLAAFAGPSRLSYHSVARILDDCPAYLTLPDEDITPEERRKFSNFCYDHNSGADVDLSLMTPEAKERYWRLAMRHMRVNINARQVYPEPCPFLFED
eukprot:gene7060-5000_t